MLILPAAPAAAVSGKQDDQIVFFRWRGNQAARSYTIPANPKTVQQTNVRTALAQLSSQWQLLTDGERETWNSYAANFPTKDRFGRDVTPTGLNWYIKANSNRSYMGLSSVDTAPVLAPPAPLSITNFAANQQPVPEVTGNIPGTPAAGFALKVLIEVLPTVGWTPSIRRSRMIQGVTAGSYLTITATADQSWAFESDIPFVAGQMVASWIITVRIADGTESVPVNRSIVAVL